MDDNTNPLPGVDYIKKRYGIGDHKAYSLIRKKGFPSFRISNKWYVIPSELHKWEIEQTYV